MLWVFLQKTVVRVMTLTVQEISCRDTDILNKWKQRYTAEIWKDQGSGRFRCVLRLITRASSKVHISCISKWTLFTFLVRVSSTLGGSFSSNSSFLFALHSLIPWVLLNPLLDFSDFRANRPLASRTSRRLPSVPLASAGVPGKLSFVCLCLRNCTGRLQPSTVSLELSTTANHRRYRHCFHPVMLSIDRWTGHVSSKQAATNE